MSVGAAAAWACGGLGGPAPEGSKGVAAGLSSPLGAAEELTGCTVSYNHQIWLRGRPGSVRQWRNAQLEAHASRFHLCRAERSIHFPSDA